MVDVFISYSREDQALVRRLADAVKREGYTVWWDDELPPHLSYGDVITEKIGEAKAAIVVWSQTAAVSEWVRAEADVARNQKKLIQTSIDGRMPPMPFNQIQFADIGDWQGEADHPGWRKVKASLSALCGEGAVAQAAKPATPPPERRRAAAPPPTRGSILTPVLLAALVAALLAVAYLLWSQRREAPPPPAPVPAPLNQTAAPEELLPEPAPLPVAQPRAQEGFDRRAVIDDPDGFTNVRAAPAVDAPIVGRVNRGEVFSTHVQDGGWWQVRLADGTEGYMARSRIRLVGGGESGGAGASASEPGQRGMLTPEQQRIRRFCMTQGRGTAQCRRFFQQMQSLRKEGRP